MYVHQGPNLYLAADQQTVVEEGDPRAAYVLVVKGGSLPDDVAEKHGLTGEKARATPTNKLKIGPGANKGQLQPRELAPGEQLEEGELPPKSQATVAEVVPGVPALDPNTGEAPAIEEEPEGDGIPEGVQEDGQGLPPVAEADVEFTPAPAFEAAVQEEAPKRRGRKTSEG